MGLSSLAGRTRTAGLAAALLAGGVLLAQAAPAGAAPAPISTPRTAATTTGSTTTSTAGTTSAPTPTRTGTSSAGKPAATAPPTPTDPGPPCPGAVQQALYPVICLPADSGEEQTASLTPGDTVEFDAQVVNNGPAVADANVVITLPQGLELESDEDDPVYRIDDWYEDDEDGGNYTDLDCTGGPSTITCSVGALGQKANILVGIDLQIPDDAVPGTTENFSVALQPVGTPTYPATSVSAAILVLAPSHVVVSLSPAAPRVVVGRHATVTGTVRNAGPGAAPDTLAVAIAVDEKDPGSTHFAITNGIAPTTTKIVIAGVRTATRVQARLQRQALSRPAPTVHRDAMPSIRFWPLGTIAPGAVTQVPIELKALSLGTDNLTFGALSTADGDDCDDDGGGSSGGSSASASEPASVSAALARAPQAASTTTAPADCSFLVQTRITAIRPPAAAAPLAATGARGLDTEVGIAVWAVVIGAGLVWLGRRRRVVAGRHQI